MRARGLCNTVPTEAWFSRGGTPFDATRVGGGEGMWTGRLAGARAPSTTVWSDVTTLPLELGRDVELGAGLPDRLPESGGGAEGEMLLGCRLVKTGDRTGDVGGIRRADPRPPTNEPNGRWTKLC